MRDRFNDLAQNRYEPYDSNFRGGRGRGGFGGRGRGRGGGSRGGYRNNNDNNFESSAKYERIDEPEEKLFNKANTGINFDKYDDIPVEVFGVDAPNAVDRFSDADLDTLIQDNIERCGYTKPTPIQKHCIPIVQAGRDLMACAQTGSGKTAAFLLPVINALMKQGLHKNRDRFNRKQANPRLLVLAPTRELCQQIYDEARKFTYRTNLKSVVVFGGASRDQQQRQLNYGCDLLFATPGRLKDFCDSGVITFSDIKYLVLDEADRMLDMGFEPQIRNIVSERDMPQKGDRVTLLYSATFPPTAQKMALDFLTNEIFVQVGIIGAATDNVKQEFLQVEEEEKDKELLRILKQIDRSERVLIFCATKRIVTKVETLLNENGYACAGIHGDKTQAQRDRAIRQYKSGEINYLIGTDVAQRGLDIPKISYVINYDLPYEIDSYVHRIGRAGRAGHTGIAYNFYNKFDAVLAKDLIKILDHAKMEVPEYIKEHSEYPHYKVRQLFSDQECIRMGKKGSGFRGGRGGGRGRGRGGFGRGRGRGGY
ncbi:hypothetical protein ABK040_012995 [Willaertia magna]